MASQSATIESGTLFPGELLLPPLARSGFQLTPSDAQMIRRIYEYRFLHIEHLAALTGRSYKKVHGRLLKLVQNHFLARIELPFQKHIYVIGREGISVLVEQGIASREVIEWRLRHHELKELFLKHQLMLVDLHCMLELASRGTGVSLPVWREGKELWDSVTTWLDRERVELPVCPDAYFVLEDSSRPEGRNRLNFFVEADRSTATHKRFQQKLIAYRQYLEDGLHTRKYGIKTFRVVTFTLTPERAANLSAAARDVLPPDALKYFLFASVDRLSLRNAQPILSDIFVSPREPERSGVRFRLVPAV
jgi:hypothetical protein